MHCFFIFRSWFTEIMKTLPKPNPPPTDTSKQLPASGPNAPPPTYRRIYFPSLKMLFEISLFDLC